MKSRRDGASHWGQLAAALALGVLMVAACQQGVEGPDERSAQDKIGGVGGASAGTDGSAGAGNCQGCLQMMQHARADVPYACPDAKQPFEEFFACTCSYCGVCPDCPTGVLSGKGQECITCVRALYKGDECATELEACVADTREYDWPWHHD